MGRAILLGRPNVSRSSKAPTERTSASLRYDLPPVWLRGHSEHVKLVSQFMTVHEAKGGWIWAPFWS
jgi:hypothetical protein